MSFFHSPKVSILIAFICNISEESIALVRDLQRNRTERICICKYTQIHFKRFGLRGCESLPVCSLSGSLAG